MSRRLVLALALLALVAGGGLALTALRSGDGAPGTYRVRVDAAEGPLFDGDVASPDGTVLSALRATGLPLVVVDYPGMGTYVQSIAGREARGPAGWVYEILRDGARIHGDRSAEDAALMRGDAVRWSWTDRP